MIRRLFLLLQCWLRLLVPARFLFVILASMNPFDRLLRDQALKSGQQVGQLSSYRAAKQLRNFRRSLVRTIKDFILIILGIFSAGLGVKGFLLPNGFIDGGCTGISMLTNLKTGVPLPVILVLVNIPFLLLGLKTLGKKFFFRGILAIIGFAVCVAFMPHWEITKETLLVAVFGGFFLGLGVGLAVRGGAVLDGTEVMAIYFSRKSTLTIGDVILVFNVLIFSVAAYVLGIDVALYSILTYLSASKTVDFVIEGIEEYTGVTIISVHHEEIVDMIMNKLGRGLTVYKGEKGFGKGGMRKHDIDIIFTVITRLEISALQAEIEKIDPNAFVVMGSIKDTRGGMIKKRPLH
jgi:uncharacterized membrane-anchored protein YitT (DUF2179 family)